MKITNKYKFPEYVSEWLKADDYDYDPNCISSTTLLKPARVFILGTKYKEKIEMDISDFIAGRAGSAMHASFEILNFKNVLQEQRVKTCFMNHIVSGKFDMLVDMDKNVKKLVDIKNTSVWSLIYGKKDIEYIKQLSIYKWLCNRNGYKVGKDAEILMIFGDWSKSKFKDDKSGKYPPSKIYIHKIELWEDSITEEYVKNRLELFDTCSKLRDSELPECTSEELWCDKNKYAVMRENRKTAVKIFEDQLEAIQFKEEKQKENIKDKFYIENRIGKPRRCDYCNVSTFCNQYKKYVKEGLIIENEN